MAKARNPIYQTYRRLWDEMLSLDEAMTDRPRKQTKRMSEIERVRPLCQMNPLFASSLDHAVMGEERYWQRQGSLVLFPEDADVLKLLQRAKFDISLPRALKLPATSFMLAIPKDFTSEGLDMPGCLVTWLPIKDYNETIFAPLDKEIGYTFQRGLPTDLTDPEQMTLSICFIDPESRTPVNAKHTSYARNRFFVESDKIPQLLAAQDNATFYAATGKYTNGDMPWVGECDDNDITRQRCYMQMVLAMSVYYTATEQACVTRGLPPGKLQLSPRPGCDIRGATILHRPGRTPSPAQQRKVSEATSRREHLRAWHFRQLRDERYYKGEYADWERGSRIVFVSEAQVGG